MSDGERGLLLRDDHYCFGCGSDNPIGLRLTFRWEGDDYITRYVPLREHQGWFGRVHGGILALVLDEVLSRAALDRHGHDWVTAELTTRYVKPAPIGQPLIVTGNVIAVKSRLITSSALVRDEATGDLVAAGTAKLLRPRS